MRRIVELGDGACIDGGLRSVCDSALRFSVRVPTNLSRVSFYLRTYFYFVLTRFRVPTEAQGESSQVPLASAVPLEDVMALVQPCIVAFKMASFSPPKCSFLRCFYYR